MSNPILGQLLPTHEKQRDAVHVAIAPVTAAQPLSPGQHVGFVAENGTEFVGHSPDLIGIVDPFLKQEVQTGERFWLFLYPGTVTSLRHVWTHPTFTSAAKKVMEKL